MTASKIFLYFCFSFIGGIFLESFLEIPQPLMPGFLIFGILLISVFWKYKKLVGVGFCLLFLTLGIWRHQQAIFKITNSQLKKYNDFEENLTLIGIVSAEPDIREKIQKLTLAIKEIHLGRPVYRDILKGEERVLITVGKYPEYRYGDKLKVTGKLKSPVELEDFNYPGYLAKDGIYSTMNWPEIELLERGNYRGLTSAIYAKILNFKNKLRENINQNLSPPQSSILGAIILGDKRQLSEDLKTKLNITGLRHITAISGLHVTVLSSILMTLLIGFGLWRQQAFYFSIILIILFIIMTGLQVSAIRAGIMGGLFLLAQYLGRPNQSSRAIVFAGAVILAQNPSLLKLDIGFQLSFLAILGIIYLFPAFRNWLKFIPWEEPKSILAMTLSAYIFTLPILIYNFGYVSLVALLTNILIVPLLYWIMLFGFIFVILGIILQPLGWILSWPAWFLLTYITKIVDWFSGIPLAYKTIEIHWIWLLIFYLILSFIVWRLQEKQKLKFLNY